MSPDAPSSRPTRWVAAIAVLVLLAGIGLALFPRPIATPPPLPPRGIGPEPPPDTAGGDLVGEALRQGDVDKNRWIDEVPGVDASALDAQQRAVFVRQANRQRCTCGCGYTLAGCRVFDSTCDKSLPRVIALLDSVRRREIRDPPEPGPGER